MSATDTDPPEDRAEKTIELDGLNKTFDDGSIVAIQNIDLTIREDEFVVLVGPSGCGKTTTLRCIAGLEQPDSGEIRIGGEEITWRKPKDRDLAYVFQHIALFPHKSVRENIRFGLDMKTELPDDEKNERVEEAAEALGIRDLLDRKPSALSGGQQQRVSIGRAMVMDPSAFLLDEPFSALDANLRDKMRTEIKQLHRKLQTAMIFVTHDQEEAMTLGDRIVVMQDARIQQVGSPYEIYNEPSNLFVASFIGSPSTNLIECEVHESGDAVELENDVFSLTLEGSQASEIAGADADEVTLGIRPEHLDLDADEPHFTGEISVIEPHGSQDAVYMQAEGVEFAAVTEQHLLDSDRDSVPVTLRTDRIWLFGPDGERIV